MQSTPPLRIRPELAALIFEQADADKRDAQAVLDDMLRRALDREQTDRAIEQGIEDVRRGELVDGEAVAARLRASL